MSLILDGKEFLSAREAAEVSSYTADYISRLIRSGEMAGQRIGRAWFVERATLDAFLKKSESEHAERSEALRQERLAELYKPAQSIAHSAPATARPSLKTPPLLHASVSAVSAARALAAGAIVATFLFAFAAGTVASSPQFGRAVKITIDDVARAPVRVISAVAEFDLRLGSRIVHIWNDRDAAFEELAIELGSAVQAGTDSAARLNLASVAAYGSSAFERASGNTANVIDSGIAWYRSLFNSIALWFKKDEAIVLVATSTPSASKPVAVAPPRPAVQPVSVNQTVVNRSVTERVTENIIYTGVSESLLAAKLNDLESRIRRDFTPFLNQNPNPYAFPSGAGGINAPITHTVVSSGSSSVDLGSISGILAVSKGGTGTSTAPAYGQLLLGNASGGYDLVATSSLGITAGLSGSGADNTLAYWSGGNLLSTTSPTVGFITATSTTASSTFSAGISAAAAQFANLISCDTIDTDASGYLKCGSDSGAGVGSPGGADTAVQYNTNGAFGGDVGFTYASSTDTLTVVNASTTRVSASYASSTNAFFGSLSVGSLSGFLKATAGAVSTSLINLASDITGTLGIANGGTGTTTAPVSQLLYGGSSAYQSVATTSLSLSGAFSHSGTLGALVGGSAGTLSLATNGVSLTNLAQIAANSILGNSTGATGNVTAIATSSLFAGTNGQVLARVNGTWTGVATTTFSGGLTYSGGNVTADLGTSIDSSEITDGSIVNADVNGSAAIAYSKLSLAGSVQNSDLVNSTISGISLGGNLANLSATDSTLTFSGTYNGSTARTIGLNLGNANTWTALQQFGNASTSLLSSYGPSYFGGTATTTIDRAGNVVVGGTLQVTGQTTLATSLSGILKAASGVVSTATAGTDYIAGGAGAATTTVSCSGNASCTSFVAFGSSPITISASGGSGTSAYEIATTSSIAVPDLAYFTQTGGRTTLGSVATTSLTLSGAFSHSGTLGALVGGSAGTLSLATNGVSLTNLAQIAANSILGNSTGATGNVTAVATSSLFTWSGTGSVVRDTSPTLTTPNLGTPSAITLTNGTGLPISTGVSGLGTGVATALGVNVGSAGAFVVNGGALGTPSSGTLTNATGLPLSTGVTGTLGIANGGTGTTTAPVGHLIYGGTSAYQSVATSSISLGSSLSTTAGSLGYQVGGSNVTINTVQDIRTSASPTFVGLTLSGLADGCLQANSGALTSTGSACGTGGGGSSGGTWSTTTSSVAGRLINYSNNFSDIVAIGSNATTSAEYWFDPNTTTAFLSGFVGIGTTSPYARLSVVGQAVAEYFSATSTTLASVFPLANITKLSNLTTDGVVYTSGSDGTLNVDAGALDIARGGTATTTFYGGGVVFSDGSKLTQSRSAKNFFWNETDERLGIGTSSPQTLLHVSGATQGAATIESQTGSFGPFLSLKHSVSDSGRDWQLYSAGSSQVGFGGAGSFNIYDATAAATRLTITTGGNIGVGSTTPLYKLSVEGSSSLGNEARAGYFTSTTTATSTLAGGIDTARVKTSATSTFAGVQIASEGLSIGSLSGFLKATAGAVTTATIDLVNDVGSSILAVANGGTGWSNLQANTVLLGNGTSRIATTSAGTNGQVLALVGGVPTWTSTTTFSGGLTYSGGNVSSDLGTSIDSSEITDGAIVNADVNASAAIAYSKLNLASSITNSDVSSSAAISYSKLNLASSVQNSDLVNSTISGISLGSNLANLSAADSTLTFSGTYNGGTARTIGLNLANANTWTALQQFSNASTSLFSSYGTSYFGGTATTTIDRSGNVVVAGTLQVTGQTTLATSLSGLLKAASGVVSAAVAGTDYIAGGAGAATTTLTISGPFNTSATPVVFGSSPITSTYYGLATTTSLSSSNLLYSTNGAAGVSSVATTSLTLSGAFSHSGTLGALVGGNAGTLSLATNGVSLTNLAQIAANSILGNSTGATGNVTAVATSSLFTWSGTGSVVRDTSPTLTTPNLGTPSAITLTNGTGLPLSTGVTGTLGIANGGTGTTTTAAGYLTYWGSSTQRGVATTSVSCSGSVSCTSFTTIGSTPITITGSGSSYDAWSHSATFGVTASATTSPLWAQSGLYASSTVAFGTAGKDAYFDATNGWFGIGTTSPYRALSIQAAVTTDLVSLASTNTSGASIRFEGNGTYDGRAWRITAGGSSNSGILGTNSQNKFGIIDATANAARITIDSSGNVGIGTTTPYVPGSRGLTVGNAGGQTAIVIDGSNSGSSGGAALGIYNAGSALGYFGNNSAISGGAYDSAMTLSGFNGIKLNTSGAQQAILDTAGKFGLGSTTPWAQLSLNPNALGSGVPEFVVGSSTATHFIIDGAGRVGIGDTAPTEPLTISVSNNFVLAGFERIQAANDTGGYLTFRGGTTGGTDRGFVGFTHVGSGSDTIFTGELANAMAIRSQGAFQLGTNGDNIRMTIDTSGNVGFGTTTPSALLSVGGNVIIGASTAGGSNGTLTYGGVTLSNSVTGTGSMVLSTSPTLTTPNLGTPSAITLTNATGLPVSTGITGLGTGVATALGVNVGSAGAFVTFNGALGTPSSGTLTNATGLPISTGVSGLGSGVATFLATPSSANLATAVTGETGSGALVFGTSPSVTTLSVSSGGIAVTGNSTIAGTLGSLTGITSTGLTTLANASTTLLSNIGTAYFGATATTTISSTGAITTPAVLTVSSGGITVTGNSTITGTLGSLTGLTSSGTITFSGLTASRAVCTTTGGQLTVTCASSDLASSLSNETGTGSVVFSASPTLTGTLTAASATFSGTGAFGTTTAAYPLVAYSNTGSQLALSFGAGFSQWVFNNVNGNLYIATTTVAGTATSTTAALQLNTNGTLIVGGGTGKITLGTFDPVYTINGTAYATYATGMIGIKEEVTGVADINQPITAPDGSTGYARVISFDDEPEGSDLWLFAHTTHIRKNIGELAVLLSGESNTKVWYQIDRVNRKVYLLSDKPARVSYRMTAPRFDSEMWTNYNHDGVTGFTPPADDQSTYFDASGFSLSFSGELLSGTTTVSELTSSSAQGAPAWAGALAGASDGLKNALAVLSNAVIQVYEGAQYFADGIFKRIFASEVHTDMLCVTDSGGQTCITRSQLDALIAGAAAASNNQTPPPAAPADNGGDEQGSSDTEAPVITVQGNNPAEIYVGDTYADLGASVTDNVNNNLGITTLVDGVEMQTPVIDTSTAGVHTILYRATDQAGNVGEATRTVTVLVQGGNQAAAPEEPPADGSQNVSAEVTGGGEEAPQP